MGAAGNGQQIKILPAIQGVKLPKDTEKFNSFIRDYWVYYLKLEEEFIATAKYVEYHKDNYKTYSLEFLKLFQAVCSEIDVVGKMMAADIYNRSGKSFKSKEATIQKWWFPIQYNFRNEEKNSVRLSDETVVIYETYEMQPWKGYEVENCRSVNNSDASFPTKEYMRLKQDEDGKTIAATPSWWRAYNDVKHQRTSVIKGSLKKNFSKANLWNLSNAYAALYILERAYLYEIGKDAEYTGIKASGLFPD